MGFRGTFPTSSFQSHVLLKCCCFQPILAVAQVPKAAESASADELRKVKEELATLMARLSTVEGALL